MLDDLAALTADLENIRKARATGAKRVRYRDGREIEYHSVDDMAALERDFERRIAAFSQPRITSIRIASSKGVR